MKLKCDAGLTAEEWARKEGHTALADLIARGGEDESDDEVRAMPPWRAAAMG